MIKSERGLDKMPREYFQGTDYIKVPIGVVPETIWKQTRFNNLGDAIKRYIDAALPVPEAWLEEYNRLGKEIQ
jgi:hypothetical protein